MPDERKTTPPAPSLAYALSIAPTAVGCGLGLLLGKLLSPRASTITAVSLLTIGIASGLPATVIYISKRINHPSTNRGTRRRLDGIRDASIPSEGDAFGEFGMPLPI